MGNSEAKTSKFRARRIKGERVFRFLILGMAIVLAVLWIVLGVFDEPSKPDNWTNSYSTGPGGHHALVELLKENHYDVERSSTQFRSPDSEFYEPYDGKVLALIEPRPAHVENHLSEFENFFEGQFGTPNVILVLPKRYYHRINREEAGDIVLEEERFALSEVQRVLDALSFGGEFTLRREEQPTEIIGAGGEYSTLLEDDESTLQYFEATSFFDTDRFEIILKTPDGKPLAIATSQDGGEGQTIVVSDPDIFTNRFLGKGEAANLAISVFDYLGQIGVSIDESMHGFTSQANIEYLAATPPGLWATTSLFLLLLIFGWREATVLRPRHEREESRRSRAYAIEGVARLMSRAKDDATASKNLLRRAGPALVGRGTQVHTIGLRGTATRSLQPSQQELLNGLKEHRHDGAAGLIKTAQAVSELMREDAAKSHTKNTK